MIHKNCGGSIVLDLSGMYVINSPSITITTKGITPGMVQIDSSGEKKHQTLMCKKCHEHFTTKDEFEDGILETCTICQHDYSPSFIKVTDYIPRICNSCSGEESTLRNAPPLQRRMYSLYAEIIHKGDHPTLLTILCKKS